ncbi:hypothetical protein PIB30_035080 [Stylosanthes scabra]|uniref:Uncharacterized protein n=1 Tax=Stylosanthes scabra TaxID=79078 RepID=A0ABU6QDI1_9FABA|nr:hypothetical protein [Stylosanthes scabra]
MVVETFPQSTNTCNRLGDTSDKYDSKVHPPQPVPDKITRCYALSSSGGGLLGSLRNIGDVAGEPGVQPSRWRNHASITNNL